MTDSFVFKLICHHLSTGVHVALLLEYEGALAPIAPVDAGPDDALLDLLTHLARVPIIQTVVLSRQPLCSLQSVLPVPRLTLAGLHGAEIEHEGVRFMRTALPAGSRRTLFDIYEEWRRLLDGKSGFRLEDRGLAIVLHARSVERIEADPVLAAAQEIAAKMISGEQFKVISEERFLAIVPVTASRGQTVDWLLHRNRLRTDLPVYFGCDPKDEEALAVVRRRGGIPIGVGEHHRFAEATEQIPSHDVVREWLKAFVAAAS